MGKSSFEKVGKKAPWGARPWARLHLDMALSSGWLKGASASLHVPAVLERGAGRSRMEGWVQNSDTQAGQHLCQKLGQHPRWLGLGHQAREAAQGGLHKGGHPIPNTPLARLTRCSRAREDGCSVQIRSKQGWLGHPPGTWHWCTSAQGGCQAGG
jgi:hypothetical protein